ncbi:thiosulfate oxidation carrier complex protein SoxZ [Marinobacterium ramblicola]|uniref:thiosulfate oxidation carrier complex protein SoxZ n=1 Tax=Marinobacterium ramblicola TaxID=2849041 RepID=UPI001C2D24B9
MSWLKRAVLFALLGLCEPVLADLPLLNGNLQVPYMAAPRYESSADVLLQMPRQVDPAVPVPIGIRVLQDGVRSITLLTDEVEPVELARFDLEPGARPELSTRIRAREGGVLVVVRTDARILAARRDYTLVTGVASAAHDSTELTPALPPSAAVSAGAAGSSAAPAAVVGAAESEFMQSMELRAWRRREVNYVELRPVEPLSSRVQHLDGAPVAQARLERFELFQADNPLLSASIGDRLWFEPYFRFSFSTGEVGDELVLSWRGPDGSEGQLSTTILASD